MPLTSPRSEVIVERLFLKDDRSKYILMLDRLEVNEDEYSESYKGHPHLESNEESSSPRVDASEGSLELRSEEVEEYFQNSDKVKV